MELLRSYGILSPLEASEYSANNGAGLSNDPAKRREAKINQYKREKELREKINVSLSSCSVNISTFNPDHHFFGLLRPSYHAASKRLLTVQLPSLS